MLALLQKLKSIPEGTEFEAHYWGRFKVNPWKADPVVIAFAHKIGAPSIQLYYHMHEGFFSIPQLYGHPIAFTIEALCHPTLGGYQDHRVAIDQLLPVTHILNTKINDLEIFEELGGYHDLFRAIAQCTHAEFQTQHFSIEHTVGLHKHVQVIEGNQIWTTNLSLSMYDPKFMDLFNDILKSKKAGFILAYTLNEKMEMLLLKLDANQYQELDRRGMLL